MLEYPKATFNIVASLLILCALLGCETPPDVPPSYGKLGENDQASVDEFYSDSNVVGYREEAGNTLDGHRAVRMINDIMEGPTSQGVCGEDTVPNEEGRDEEYDFSASTVVDSSDMPAASRVVNSHIKSINYNEEEALEKGYYTYGESHKRYGTERTKWRILKAGEKLAEEGIVMGLGNVSKAGGGRLPPHMSHRKGVDADLRLIGKNGKAQRCNVNHPKSVRDSCYDVEKTFKMVKNLIDVDVRNVRKVFINDPELRSMINQYYAEVSGSNRAVAEECPGHDDHIHMSWKN